jgi:hypothetical protein
MNNDVVPVQQFSYSELDRMAHAIAKSGLFAVKTPEAALTLLLISQAEGTNPVNALMDYDLIGGKPALKSSAMLARFQRSGGRVKWLQSTDACVEGHFTHPVGGELTVKWDTERVKTAGLAGREIHQKFPLQMKRARCISEACRALAPNAIPLGIYTVEEQRDIPEETVVATVSLDKAVSQAVEEVKKAMPDDDLESLIMKLDVNTREELVAAYNAGVERFREIGNKEQFEKFKWHKDLALASIETGTI